MAPTIPLPLAPRSASTHALAVRMASRLVLPRPDSLPRGAARALWFRMPKSQLCQSREGALATAVIGKRWAMLRQAVGLASRSVMGRAGPVARLQRFSPVLALRRACAFRALGSVASGAAEARLQELRARHSELSDMFAEGKVAPSAMAKLSRELNFVSRVVETADALAAAEEELRDLRAMIDEFSGQSGSEAAEMVSMAKDDAGPVAERAAELDEALADLLAPRDEADDRDAIVEVRAGAGGDEAALFVGDMAGMYSAFAARKGWTWEVIEESQAPSGGFKEVSATVAGAGAYGALKWERGTHRVQRVPATESAGRVHTSTITVAVMPQADEVDIDIRPSDIRIDTYRASGAGGQHVNTTDSAVRLTHIPTNTVVTCQNERSQHQNKAMAMKVLYSRIFETAREKEAEAQAASRRSQIGTGERSERIRTYNWNQDRVTDHRVGLTK